MSLLDQSPPPKMTGNFALWADLYFWWHALVLCLFKKLNKRSKVRILKKFLSFYKSLFYPFINNTNIFLQLNFFYKSKVYKLSLKESLKVSLGLECISNKGFRESNWYKELTNFESCISCLLIIIHWFQEKRIP